MENSKKIKVLIFLRYVGSVSGGVQRLVDSYYSRFDREKFDIEYLVLTHEESLYERHLEEQGIKIHTIKGIKERNILILFFSCRKFFSKHHDYDIIHCHQTNFDFIPLFWAMIYKIPIRIIHSHNTGYNINVPQFLCEKYLTRLWANRFMAASIESGCFLFGKQKVKKGLCTIVTSAIEISTYSFNSKIREEKRKKLSISEGTTAFCQIARISQEKRQEVTLRAFQQVHKKEPTSKLFFVGAGGDYEDKMKDLTNELGIEDSVVFLGIRTDVPQLLQAFDVFVMPSLFEAMLIALTEALASGMPCLISDAVGCVLSSENGVMRIKTEAAIDVWADGMLQCMKMPRRDNTTALYNAGFSIDNQAERLQKCYEEMCGF